MSYEGAVADILKKVTTFIRPVELERVARPSPTLKRSLNAHGLPRDWRRESLQPRPMPLLSMNECAVYAGEIDADSEMPATLQHVLVPVESYGFETEAESPQAIDWMRDALIGNPVRLRGKEWTIIGYGHAILSNRVRFYLQRLQVEILNDKP